MTHGGRDSGRNVGNRWGGEGRGDNRESDETGEVGIGDWEGRRAGARIEGVEGSDEGREDGGRGEVNAAMGNGPMRRDSGAD
jgi:hypothetical protein